MPGSWLIASVCIERMTQSSSAKRPVWLMMSLYSMPLWPYLLKSTNEPASESVAWYPLMPVRRCPWRTESGSGCRCFSRRSGFGSSVSNCEGPPAWNR